MVAWAAEVAARPASARAIAEADWASDSSPLQLLAWNEAHAVATAATARMIAVHEQMRCRRSHALSGSGGSRPSPRATSTTSSRFSSRPPPSVGSSAIGVHLLEGAGYR